MPLSTYAWVDYHWKTGPKLYTHASHIIAEITLNCTGTYRHHNLFKNYSHQHRLCLIACKNLFILAYLPRHSAPLVISLQAVIEIGKLNITGDTGGVTITHLPALTCTRTCIKTRSIDQKNLFTMIDWAFDIMYMYSRCRLLLVGEPKTFACHLFLLSKADLCTVHVHTGVNS